MLGFRQLLLILFGVMSLCACQSVITAQDVPANTNPQLYTQIYLVRHAEKRTDKKDPGLTLVGEARAKALAKRLVKAGITDVHSSDYTRTRDTARPIAEQLSLPVTLYDPRALENVAQTLKTTRGVHLVVGHSNTTPQLVELLGGDGGAPIIEATEYDRLYWVQIFQDGEVITQLMRYGMSE